MLCRTRDPSGSAYAGPLSQAVRHRFDERLCVRDRVRCTRTLAPHIEKASRWERVITVLSVISYVIRIGKYQRVVVRGAAVASVDADALSRAEIFAIFCDILGGGNTTSQKIASMILPRTWEIFMEMLRGM